MTNRVFCHCFNLKINAFGSSKYFLYICKMKLVKLSEYAKMKGVSVRTLRRRMEDGSLITTKTPTGRIMVNIEEERNEYVITYARVSSSENKANLLSQSKRLQDFCAAKGWIVKEVIEEVGSGLNDDRKKLSNVFLNKKVTKVVVEHKDRLTRFGFNYLKKLWNVEIIVINEVEEDEKDLMQDFVSLVTSFCARLYGKRRTKRNTEKLIKDLTNT